jgi:hypothetical protein
VSRAAGARLLLATALALLAGPAFAAASPLDFPFHLPAGVPPQLRALVRERMGTSEPPRPSRSEFELKTSNGYRIGVLGMGRDVIVEVTRNHGSAATAYVARGTVTPGRLRASFGDLGEVAVSFRPSGRVEFSTPRRHCHGASQYRSRLGVFVGEIRLRGENGFFSVHSQRAKGKVRDSLDPRCERGHFGRQAERSLRPSQAQATPQGLELSFLSASWRHAVSSASFGALGTGKKTLFLASAEQSEGRVATFRFAIKAGPSQALAIDSALTQARVSPPAPFRGTGTYRAAPDGTTTWTGGLSVNFPGAGHFPLVGPSFKADIGTGF